MTKHVKRLYLRPTVEWVSPEDDIMTTGTLTIGSNKTNHYDVKEQDDWEWEEEDLKSNPGPSIELKSIWEKNW